MAQTRDLVQKQAVFPQSVHSVAQIPNPVHPGEAFSAELNWLVSRYPLKYPSASLRHSTKLETCGEGFGRKMA